MTEQTETWADIEVGSRSDGILTGNNILMPSPYHYWIVLRAGIRESFCGQNQLAKLVHPEQFPSDNLTRFAITSSLISAKQLITLPTDAVTVGLRCSKATVTVKLDDPVLTYRLADYFVHNASKDMTCILVARADLTASHLSISCQRFETLFARRQARQTEAQSSAQQYHHTAVAIGLCTL
jgi:hypothetical protein